MPEIKGVQEHIHAPVTSPRGILVVEDDEALRNLVLKALGRKGYSAQGVSTGAEALERIRDDADMVMLLDHKLPDMTGADLVNVLIEQDLAIPFIVMTGQGDERLAVEMMKLGAADYLIKDLSLTDLLPAAFQRLFRKLDTEERLHRAEDALRDSEKRYRELVESSNSIILRMDKEGRLLFFNEFAEKFYGYAKEEILGKNVVGTIVPVQDSQNKDMAAMIRDIAVHPEQYAINENENMLNGGRRVWVSWSNRVVCSESGVIQILCIGHDVTERKQAEEALLRAKEQAEVANKAKSEFLANMSHEIRTPLNGITGIMQFLQTTPLDEEQGQCVGLAITSAHRLTRLLSDILDLSRIEAGRMEIREEAFSIRELTDSVTGLFMVSAREKGMTLECSIDPSMPSRIISDEARLRQILFNLVGNALKYSDKGKIRLEIIRLSPAKGAGLRVLFSVTDTGIGIPEDRFKDIFEPFRQVDGSYTRRYQGAGLGLAIVRRLVELMDGGIFLESVPGEGTSVHVVLPCQTSEQGAFVPCNPAS